MNTVKLKYVAELNPRVDFKKYKQEITVSFLPMECVKKGYIIPKETILDNYNNSYNCFEDNDIVMAKVTPCFENGNIAIASNLDNGIGFGSSELLVLRAQKCLTKHLFYVLQDEKFRQIAISTMTGAGGLKRILPEAVKSYAINNLSIKQQQHIADYLDRKTDAIDSLIADKQKLVELLKEKRQAVISEAVTKGLDKNVKTKDSGIEWIGEIPEDWEVRKFNDLCVRITDFVASGSFASLRENVQYYDNENYAMLIRTMDVSNKNNNITHVYIDETAYNFLKNSNLYGGEIILPNIGASVGDVYRVPNLYERMSLAPNSIMFKTLYEDMYYYYYFSSTYGRNALIQISQSAAQPKFNKTELRQLKVLVPLVDIQKEIVSYLNIETNKIDSLIAYITEQIEKLKEYRQAIISESVTGKVAI